jgi:hypothetical protein
MEIAGGIVAETVAALVGIFVGTLAALLIDRRSERRRLRRQARVVLQSLARELDENYREIQTARPAYVSTPWGKSFVIRTASWETATAGGELPQMIGFELMDAIAAQYAALTRMRYYVDLLTRLWLSSSDVTGYDEMRRGFMRRILEAMSQALGRHPALMGQMDRVMRESVSN